MKPEILLLCLLFIACQTPKNKVLSRYEKQIKTWEKQTIQGKILDIRETDSLREAILRELQGKKLTRNQADWLNALNRRYEILVTKQEKRFPDAEIPEDIKQFLQIREKITAKNLPEYYRRLSLQNKQNPLFGKSYHYLEKYRILFVDSLSDEARLNIEKIRLELENLSE